MDQRVRFRAAYRCAARPADPPRAHPRDERRELQAQSEQAPLTPCQLGHPCGQSDPSLMPDEKATSSGPSCQHRRCIFAPANRCIFAPALTVDMSSIKRLARATTSWLIHAGLVNDLTTLSDRDLRDVGLVRQQIGKTTKLLV